MEPPGHGMLQEATPSQQGGRFRPYLSTKHRVTRGRYITSNDKRGYIPVYEYPLNGQWIMMDIDDGYILWTGIWKALGNAKADIVKMLESQPDLAPQLRRVRGGYLKIQGTWMPYEVALRLARRVAWNIREDLIPLFGPTFPQTCLAPDQPGYGQILGAQPGKRRGRRAIPLPAALPPPHASETTSGSGGQQTLIQSVPGPSALSSQPPVRSGEYLIQKQHSPSQIAGPSGTGRTDYFDDREPSGASQYAYSVRHGQPQSALPHTHRYSEMGPPPPPSAYARHGGDLRQILLSPTIGSGRDTSRRTSAFAHPSRYEPYQTASRLRSRSAGSLTPGNARPTPIDLPPLTIPSSHTSGTSEAPFHRHPTEFSYSNSSGAGIANLTSASTSATPSTSLSSSIGENIVLPPIQPPATAGASPRTTQPPRDSTSVSGSSVSYALPPISALDELPPTLSQAENVNRLDSAAVLKRLALDDEVLGRSRAGSTSITQDDEESSHRDRDSNVFAVARPTHEQLWTRRRSLSAPPMQPDMYSKPQNAWSAAPNIGLGNAATSTSILLRPTVNSPSQVSPSSYDESMRRGVVNSPHLPTEAQRDERSGEWWSNQSRHQVHRDSAGEEHVGTALSYDRSLAHEYSRNPSRASSSGSLASTYANVRGQGTREHLSNTIRDHYYVEEHNPQSRDLSGRHRNYSHLQPSSPLDRHSQNSPISRGRVVYHAGTLPPIASESLEQYRFGRRRSPSPSERHTLESTAGQQPDELGNSGTEMGAGISSISSRADGG